MPKRDGSASKHAPPSKRTRTTDHELPLPTISPLPKPTDSTESLLAVPSTSSVPSTTSPPSPLPATEDSPMSVELPLSTPPVSNNSPLSDNETALDATTSTTTSETIDQNQTDFTLDKPQSSTKLTKTPTTQEDIVTVQSIVPKPTKSLIDADRVAGFSDVLLRRLQALSTYTNAAAKTFALSQLPPNATWGKYDHYDDKSKDLCIPTTNERIHIWIIGHVTSLWFIKNGVPDRQCAITVLPLSHSLGLQANRLISGLSIPALPASLSSTPGVIRAVRWQSPGIGAKAILFNSVYDARQVLLTKNAMEKYNTLELKKRDLVLLEMRIIRYRQKDDKGKWIQRAQFELQAISILANAPEPESSSPEHSVVDIPDLQI